MLGSIEIENFGDLKRKDLKNWWYFDGVFIILMETLDKFRHSIKILKVPPFWNFKEKSIRVLQVLQVPNDRRPFIPSSSFIPRHLQQQRRQEQQFILLHASKNEGLESGFEVDRLGKALHGFPSGRYFKKVDQCLLALFFPDVAGVSSKNIQQAGPSRDRRNEKAYLYLDGQYHKEVSFFLFRVLKTKPVKLLNFHFCHFLSRLARETKL